MTDTRKNQEPFEKLKDGKLTVAIWKNKSNEGDTFYSISPTQRREKTEEGYQNYTSLSGVHILQSQRLQDLAYSRIRELEAADYAASQEANSGS